MPSEKWNVNSAGAVSESWKPHTIRSINTQSDAQKREIYMRLIPNEIIQRFNLEASLRTPDGRDLLYLNCPAESSLAEMALYHEPGAPDPILYGQITDTITGHLHILLYLLNDPRSPRFDVDCMPDGRPTQFGTRVRNLPAELDAMHYGLAPGQVRRGLRLLGPAVQAFERLVASLDQEIYFVEPLHYHNAIIFEHYGFSYLQGKMLMERIQAGFSPDGDLTSRLDSSTPFRRPEAAQSIRLRSWALHDGLLGQPFTGVTMYKRVGSLSNLDTCPGCTW
jgi:hypothetical protein